jgi:hypothetical protein
MDNPINLYSNQLNIIISESSIVKLFELSGRNVLSKVITQGRFMIHLYNIPKGVYLAKIYLV